MFGFRARNNDDVIQVSSDRAYMSLHEEGYLAIGSAYDTTITFTRPCTTTQPPMIFIRANSGSAGETTTFKCGVVGSAGNWTGFRLINGNTTQINYLYWFAAIWAPLTASGDYGMRLRDASGQVCFHSSSQLVKFSRFITHWTYLSGGAGVQTYTSGQTIAADEYALVSQCHTYTAAIYGSVSRHIGLTFDAAGVIKLTVNGGGVVDLDYFPVLLAKKS